MQKLKKITVKIDNEGNCEIEGKGFIGPECSHFINEIESILGTIISQKNKPEYCQRRKTNDKNLQKGGR